MARWRRRGDGWENIAFKRVPAGWLYPAPNPWIFFRPRYYLVSDSERAELIAGLENAKWRFILLAAPIVAGAVPFGLWLVPMLWNSVLLVMLLLSILAGALVNGCLWWILRPLLVHASPTTERIAMGDLLRAWAAVVPVGELIIFAILLIALFACAAYATLTSSRWGMDELIAIPLLGLMAAYSIALLAAKRRMSAGPWS
jgi:hypothetical protein